MRALVPIALLLVAGLWPAGGGAVDNVPVRAWPHDGYGRLVFDWSAPVDYSAEIADGRLVVEFDRPFEVDLDAALELLSDYVATAQSDPAGRTLRFELSAPFRLRHFVANGSVVVDLIKDGASAKAKAPADAPRVRVRAGEHKAYSRPGRPWTKMRPTRSWRRPRFRSTSPCRRRRRPGLRPNRPKAPPRLERPPPTMRPGRRCR